MPAPLTLQCLPADYDAVTATCAAPFYAESPDAFLLSLTLEDAQVISMAILWLWAIAFGLRMCRKALQEIG